MHLVSTKHRKLGPNELEKAGVSTDTARLSIGTEHVDDLIADLEQALALAYATGALLGRVTRVPQRAEQC